MVDSCPPANDKTKPPQDATSGCTAPEHLVDPARDAYDKAQVAYKKQTTQYWGHAEADKKAGVKVLDFPPLYAGPKKPPNYEPPKPPSVLPSVNDMEGNWLKLEPMVTGNKAAAPIDETTESDFKHRYAREALHVGSEHGLTADQSQNFAQSIYAFEDGGKGTADMLSGTPMRLTDPDQPGSHENRDKRRELHPISTAMGYNQLLMATTLQFVDSSHNINDRLNQLARESLSEASELHNKEQLLEQVQRVARDQLSKFAQSNPHRYLQADGSFTRAVYDDFAKSSDKTDLGLTGRQIASGIQALNLDRDLGPVIQAQQLNEIVGQGYRPDFLQSLKVKAAEDGVNATRFGAYSDKDREGAVNELMSRIVPHYDPNQPLLGDARALQQALIEYSKNENTPLTEAALGKGPYEMLNNQILTLKRRGDAHGPLTPAASALEDNLYHNVMRHPTGDDYLPAAIELANLAGGGAADSMVKAGNENDSTVNYFDQKGYEANGITNGRTADELLKSILHVMRGDNASPNNYGMGQLIQAFKDVRSGT